MKKYRLIVSGTTFEIGEQLENQPFRLFTYEHLGIKTERDWKNLFQVHLYQDKLVLDGQLKLLPEKLQQFSHSDVLAYASRGYQVFKNLDERGFTVELYRPPTGRILDENEEPVTLEQITNAMNGQAKGHVLVPHA